MMYLPHQRHSSIMRDRASLNQKEPWPFSFALRPFCSAKPAVVGRYLQKASTASNKPERRGRPRLSRDDLPKDFFPFYNEYKQLKNSQSPLNGIVAKYANESGYSIKTIYDWINRVSQEKL